MTCSFAPNAYPVSAVPCTAVTGLAAPCPETVWMPHDPLGAGAGDSFATFGLVGFAAKPPTRLTHRALAAPSRSAFANHARRPCLDGATASRVTKPIARDWRAHVSQGDSHVARVVASAAHENAPSRLKPCAHVGAHESPTGRSAGQSGARAPFAGGASAQCARAKPRTGALEGTNTTRPSCVDAAPENL